MEISLQTDFSVVSDLSVISDLGDASTDFCWASPAVFISISSMQDSLGGKGCVVRAVW